MTEPPVLTRPPASGLSRADRLVPVVLLGAIAAGFGVGRLLGARADALAPGVPVGVFALIFLVMLGVDREGVRAALRHRRFMATAVVLNFVVNPIVAWALGAVLLADQPELRMGLVLFLVTPCIGWYLVFTELAGGDTALGVGVLGVNIVLQVALLPVYLWLFTGQDTGLAVGTVVGSVVVYLVGPTALAVATRRWGPPAVASSVPALKTALLFLVIVCMFASQAEDLVGHADAFARLVPPMVLFFAIAFGAALGTGRRLGFEPPAISALVFTTTSRNSEASLAIAATAFASPLVGLTVVLGPIVELPLLIVMARVLGSRHEHRDAANVP